ncbi:hypothetical protein F5Y18DRAFT_430943 [Xylariaceae sp. FL1019]|nr:hypothetical protein F5Y18DRAFT_430943 [Xylariaceae sp. FL1019]
MHSRRDRNRLSTIEYVPKLVEIRTVTEAQGHGAATCIFDGVRSKTAPFGAEEKRVTVAATRAQMLNIIVINDNVMIGAHRTDKQGAVESPFRDEQDYLVGGIPPVVILAKKPDPSLRRELATLREKPSLHPKDLHFDPELFYQRLKGPFYNPTDLVRTLNAETDQPHTAEESNTYHRGIYDGHEDQVEHGGPDGNAIGDDHCGNGGSGAETNGGAASEEDGVHDGYGAGDGTSPRSHSTANRFGAQRLVEGATKGYVPLPVQNDHRPVV